MEGGEKETGEERADVCRITGKVRQGETEGGLCSYTATNKTLLCSNLSRLQLLTGTEESLANLHNLQIVDSKVGVLADRERLRLMC